MVSAGFVHALTLAHLADAEGGDEEFGEGDEGDEDELDDEVQPAHSFLLLGF